MPILAALTALRDRLAAALPSAAVVAVHAEDLSGRKVSEWLIKLPGVYLTCEGVDVRGGESVMRLRVYVLARLADVRRVPAEAGWAMAEIALAVVASDPIVTEARLLYRDESGLDQPGIGLWEIEATRRHALPAPSAEPPPSCVLHQRYEELYSSWAPWIGAAHEPRYERLQGDAPSVGEQDMEALLP
ncbi:MAG: hypothetical protein N2690_00955 [Rhodocyclaceae bacterium]|nr:hypothetical protein [Rhodocyclaceae bacterium]